MKNRILGATLAAAAAAGLVLVPAAPSGAGGQSAIVVDGFATCNTGTGHETYTLHWTVASVLPIDADVTIDDATESGAFEGSVTFSPNPVPFDETATGTDGPVPNVVGTVTLTVDWSYVNKGTVSGTSVGTIHLDGSCTLPPDTATTTTAAPKPAAIARPRFTG